jgi:hypothetical protein
MAEEWLRYQGTQGVFRLKINEGAVSASSSLGAAVLGFPINWEQNYALRNEGIDFELGTGSAELCWSDGRRLAVSLPIMGNSGQYPSLIEFPMEIAQAEELERLREGRDLNLLLKVRFHSTRFSRLNIGPPFSSTTPFSPRVAVETWVLEASIGVVVPRSQYEEKILPFLGPGSPLTLIVAIPPGARDLFVEPLRELGRAQKTLLTATNEAHFESVVTNCRVALDSLLQQFHFTLPKRADGNTDASYSSRIRALKEQFLQEVLSDSQAESIENIMKTDMWNFSSGTKPGPDIHSRAYATFALHQATSLVQLVSEVLWAKQKQRTP